MSRFEDQENWDPTANLYRQPPSYGNFLKIIGVTIAEGANWILHTSTYSLANPLGSDTFIIDAVGLPEIPLISELTVGNLINSGMALISVALPVVIWYLLLTRREILRSSKEFLITH